MMNKIVSIINQNIYDLAVQYYGTVEAVFDIIEDNAELSLNLTSEIVPGTILKIKPIANEVAEYFRIKGTEVATASLFIDACPSTFFVENFIVCEFIE
jgi:hypothetical protein